MRRVLILTTAACLAMAGCGDDEPAGTRVSTTALAGAPKPLAALHAQANDLLPGGLGAYRRRLASLRGHAIVVNKWASWCTPCRAEFPFFQRLSVQFGRRIAFLGVNSNDNDGEAAEFLERYPVSYPSYRDGDSRIGNSLGFGQAFPVTAFFDRRGELVYAHPGGYSRQADLAADIRRYAK